MNSTYTAEQSSKDLKALADIVKERAIGFSLFNISAAVLDTLHRDGARFEDLKDWYGGSVVQIAKDVAMIIND